MAIAPTVVPAQEAKPASAERGYHLLRTKPYLPAALSEAEFDQLWQVWPDALKAEAENATPQERRTMAYRRYGLIVDDTSEKGLPVAVVEDGQGGWSSSCLACHGGKVAGKVIPGLGNSHYAFQTFNDDINKLRALREKQQSMAAVMQAAFVPLGQSNGTTNAQVFSILLSSRRDRDLNISAEPRTMRYTNHDLDAPPFWNVKKKSHLYIDGFAPKTHRVIMQFVLGFDNSGETIRSWENDFRDILAWIESVEAPKYPWPIDQSLARAGRVAFDNHCARCHGTYGQQAEYPELMVDIEEIGTDPTRLRGMPEEHRHFYEESWFGEYGKIDAIEKPAGYVAPPLDGIWASAPYLHNGSVPTLWHLLHPAARPVVWLRDEDGYDQERLGLAVTEFTEVPAEAKSQRDERRRYFDTRLRGKSAAGHLFPDELNEEEKRAVLEYLKTL